MLVRDYFLAALKAKAYVHRDWFISILSQTTHPDAPVSEYPYQLFTQGKLVCCLDPNGETVIIEDAFPNKALVVMKQPITLLPGDVLTVNQKATTLVGNVIFNYLAVIGPFNGKIPFQFGRCDIGALEKIIVSMSDDYPADGKELPDRIYAHEQQLYVKYGLSLGALEVFCVPAATERSMLPHPDAVKLRKKLIEERRGRLHDPAVVAEINAALEQLDREWIAGDPDKGYFNVGANKAFQVTRMRTFGIYGSEPDLVNGGYTLVEPSLVEGWDPTKLPQMATTARDGSFSRGAQTAMGGDKVKTMLRTMAGVEIPEEDCGSTIGVPTLITPALVGNSILVANKAVLLTRENIGQHKDKMYLRRSPMACKTSPNNFCMTCMGEFVRPRRSSVGLIVSEVGSNMMLVKMAAAHGRALKTETYVLSEAVS